MDVAEWLRGLGLEQYAPAFRTNDIDGEVLRRLTGDDVRELGVRSIRGTALAGLNRLEEAQ
jgi:SAM domain (Sterile alpha motif)